jgi:hypothetical protein
VLYVPINEAQTLRHIINEELLLYEQPYNKYEYRERILAFGGVTRQSHVITISTLFVSPTIHRKFIREYI